MLEIIPENPGVVRSRRLKLSLVSTTAAGESESSVSLPVWALACAAAAVVAVALISARGPLSPRAPVPEEITPLNVRDPSALIMSPVYGRCSCPCPTVKKP